ncbi:HupE/UreJ family protein [Roseateles koreensis]|uniref:HupE/UreJ family protein n=1 Tax=Roseateles koreensis TaxID=2987526 RepID=A0ABT5KTH5_9BURK|nr:HupE/UreJ family protein [Roseateles koreensis]MDC8786147.1 HupE/UreJ family protein [Roseateles koreensis]
MIARRALKCCATLGLLSIGLAAQAHTGQGALGHELEFLSGVAHPFTGLDHLLAMLAVGVWASQLWRGKARLLAPALFLALLLTGALVAQAAWVAPQLEAWVAASVVGFGGLLLLRESVPSALGLLFVGLAALVHGQAHGLELHGAQAIGGFVLGSALLHGLGLLAGAALARWPARLGQAFALALTASGLVLMLSRL